MRDHESSILSVTTMQDGSSGDGTSFTRRPRRVRFSCPVPIYLSSSTVEQSLDKRKTRVQLSGEIPGAERGRRCVGSTPISSRVLVLLCTEGFATLPISWGLLNRHNLLWRA